VISTADDESAIAVSPDGKTAYFVKRSPTTTGPTVDVICVSRYENGRWSPPQVAPFSGRYRDVTPAFAPDGSKLFFASNRPVAGEEKHDFDLWFVAKNGDGWSAPHHLGSPINTAGQEYGASVAANGNLYFASSREGGKGGFDIYRATYEKGEYGHVENLGPTINTDGAELMPAVTPDEKLLVFLGTGRDDEITGIHREYNKGDLYVSYFDHGSWTKARNAGPPVNSGGLESAPSFSADGKVLFFASERGFATYRQPRPLSYRDLVKGLRQVQNGAGNIYEVDSSVVSRGSKAP
jgi:Tol biopolymer transport system component